MTQHRTLLSCGEHAVLVELGGLDEVLAFSQAVRDAVAAGTSGFTDVVDIVPAATTVLVIVNDEATIEPVRQVLATLPTATGSDVPTSDQVIEIPVQYDGPDLAEVAELSGLSVEDVIAAHTGTAWRVAFCGFAPGFAYLAGGIHGSPCLGAVSLVRPCLPAAWPWRVNSVLFTRGPHLAAGS
jgi:allophanate hydrolase subunit 1